MKTHRFRPLNRLSMLGLLFMVIANTVRMTLEHHTTLGEQITDPLGGFLYGAGIGALLLGLWRQGRGGTACAK